MAAASSAVTPPYLAGGAPEPFAVYAPMLAGSLADSYLRIAGTGGHANLDPAVVGSGVAPTHAVGTGWGMNGTTQYLNTGIVPTANYTMLIRFSDVANNGWICGQQASGNQTNMAIAPTRGAGPGVRYIYTSSVSDVAPAVTAGVLAIAGSVAYRNGSVDVANLGTWGVSTPVQIMIGALNFGGSPSNRCQGSVLYFVIWDTDAGHATWMPAVSAAVAAL